MIFFALYLILQLIHIIMIHWIFMWFDDFQNWLYSAFFLSCGLELKWSNYVSFLQGTLIKVMAKEIWCVQYKGALEYFFFLFITHLSFSNQVLSTFMYKLLTSPEPCNGQCQPNLPQIILWFKLPVSKGDIIMK